MILKPGETPSCEGSRPLSYAISRRATSYARPPVGAFLHAATCSPEAASKALYLRRPERAMRGSNRRPKCKDRFARECRLRPGRVTDRDADVLVEHTVRLIPEGLRPMLEQEPTALRHGDHAVLIDDFVEKLDLAVAQLRTLAGRLASVWRRTCSRSPGLDRPLPSNLFDAACLFEDRRAHHERLAIHPTATTVRDVCHPEGMSLPVARSSWPLRRGM